MQQQPWHLDQGPIPDALGQYMKTYQPEISQKEIIGEAKNFCTQFPHLCFYCKNSVLE
jgi:hypothetical protein